MNDPAGTSRPSPLRDERGLTLMEILVSMAVLGIVLAATLPGFKAMMEGHRHNASISQVTSRMFLTRQMAVRDRDNYVMTLDPATSTYTVFQDQDSDGIRDAGERLLGPWGMRDGVALQNVNWPANQMTFFPNGTTSITGDVRIVDGYGRAKTIRLSSITGNAEVLP